MKKLFVAILILTLSLVCIFAACEKEAASITSISITGTYKTNYSVGDEIDLSNMYVTVNYSDGNVEMFPVNESMIDLTAFNTSSPATTKSLRVTYNNFFAYVKYSVTAPEVLSKITDVRLIEMPSSFYLNDKLPVKDGFLTSGKAVITVKDVGEVTLPIKSAWVKNFTTAKIGDKTVEVAVVSEYGDISATWSYKVEALPSVTNVAYEGVFSVYQNNDVSALINKLSDATFVVTYANDVSATYKYNSDFKISGFTSAEIGEAECSVSFTDNEKRAVKFKLAYTVKQEYPVYTVTFNENYEGGRTYRFNTEDGLVSEPKPTRVGYDLIGWYNGSEKFSFNNIVNQDTELTASWKKTEYLIKFFDEGGVLIGSATYDVDDEKPFPRPSQLPNYTMQSGYVFSHYTDYSGETVTGVKKGTTGNMVLTAHFSAIQYNVSYVLNDNGDAINANAATFSADEPIDFENAVRRGYTFEGWFSGSQSITTTRGIYKDLVLNAKWTENVYTLTRKNGLTDETIDEIKFRVSDSDTYISDYEVPSYIFYGWYFDKSYSKDKEFGKTNEGKYRIAANSSGDMTIYAYVELCYTFSLDTLILDGINPKVLTLTFTAKDETVALPIPNRSGCTFNYWRNLDLGYYIKQEDDLDTSTQAIEVNTAPIIELITTKKLRDNVLSMIADYEIHSHVIRHHFYTDVYGEEKIIEITYETTVRKDLIMPKNATFIERTGYDFVDWYREKNYSGVPITYIEAETADEDIDVYAKWSPIIYTITLHYNLEDETGLVKADIPTTYTADDHFSLGSPRLPYFKFEGWFDEEELINQHKTDIAVGSAGDLVLYAKWTPETYMIDLRNMEYGIYNGVITYTLTESLVTLADATRQGYDFEGWYKESTFIHKITSFVPAEVGTSITIYAKWSLKTYTVNYVLNDSEELPAVNDNAASFLFGETVTLTAPERNGYEFIHWYSAPAVNGVFDERYIISSVSAAIATDSQVTVYAEWLEKEYSINYVCAEADVSSLPVKYSVKGLLYNNKYTNVLPLPSRTYYTCAWTSNGETITTIGGEGFVYRDLTLTIEWTATPYTLTFTVSGKTGKYTYSADDFVDGVYTLPEYATLIEAEVFTSDTLIGKKVTAWKIGSVETETIAIKDLKNYSITAVVANIQYALTYSLPSGAEMVTPTSGQNPETFEYNATIKVTAATLSGYKFDAWYKDASYTEKAGTVSSGITSIKISVADDMTIYARFVPIYTISYVDDEGMKLSDKQTAYNELENKNLGKPTKTNYLFGGWWCTTLGVNVTSTSDFEQNGAVAGNVTIKPLFYDAKTNGVSNTSGLLFSLSGDKATLYEAGTISGKLVIPSSVSGYTVANIASGVFAGKGITSVTIGENIEVVGNSAFSSCKSLKDVTIQGSALIQNQAFKDCTALETIVISNDARVNEKVFEGCSKVKSLSFDGTNGTNVQNVYTLFGDTAAYSGYYIPTTLTSLIFTGEGATNGILFRCSTINTVTITSDSMVSISISDKNVLQGKTVYVNTQALADAYSDIYEGITFSVK